MSRENLEIVRALNEAFNRRDIDGLVGLLDPGVEWWPASDEPITDPYRGRDEIRQALAGELLDLVPDLQAEIEELIAVEERALCCYRYWGNSAQGAVPVEIRETVVVSVRDGKIVEVREYRTKAEALEAVGLSE